MSNINRRRWLAIPAGIGLVLLISTSAFAYVTQVPTLVTVTPSSETLRCGHPTVVEATVLDQAGKPIKHLAVTWSFTSSPSSGDQIKLVSKQTNGQGVARVLVRLACVSGDRVITATAGGVSGSAVVHVALDHHGANGGHGSAVTGAGVAAATKMAAKQAGPAAQGIPADFLSSTSTGSTDSPANPTLPAVVILLAAAAIIARRIIFSRR